MAGPVTMAQAAGMDRPDAAMAAGTNPAVPPLMDPGSGGDAMISERGRDLGFAAALDVPIPYLQRTRTYYEALGYGPPYEWAHYADVPFHRLEKPLSACRVTIITTAAPFQPDKGDQGPGAAYNAAAKFYAAYSGDTASDHDLCISHVAIDRNHTSAEDQATYFPLVELRRRAARGDIGPLAARFHGLPTNRSHRVTLEVDCPEVVARCKADAVDAAILVPNCPVCHQSVSLAARMLEKNGIATVVMGCAKDIVEYVGAPRFLFSDFPLGNAAGRPRDLPSQAQTLDLALKWIEAAPAPRTTVQSPLSWSDNADWKLDYCNIERLGAEEIRRRRAEFDQQKDLAKAVRTKPVPAR
jgi:D-proline reductase (dithiol) PrdB